MCSLHGGQWGVVSEVWCGLGGRGHPSCPCALQVTVLFAGQNIDGSPFGVTVGMALGDASKVTARGPGLEPVGNVANKATYFDIYTAGGGMGGGRGSLGTRPCGGVAMAWPSDWGHAFTVA